jgi:transposase
MQFFVGIDVSLESSSICVIDERGIIIKEGKVESDPQSVAKFIRHKRLSTSASKRGSSRNGSSLV